MSGVLEEATGWSAVAAILIDRSVPLRRDDLDRIGLRHNRKVRETAPEGEEEIRSWLTRRLLSREHPALHARLMEEFGAEYVVEVGNFSGPDALQET